MMKYFLLIVTLVIAGSLSIRAAYSAECLLKPKRLNIQVPENTLLWLAGEEFSGACEQEPASEWNMFQSNSTKLRAHANGPSGSGRYWKLTIGLSDNQASLLVTGFCLYTSTIGWRTLQQYDRTPLPWMNDLDKDGQAEFLLWDSFPLSDEPTMAEFGLVVWVYELEGRDNFVLDWDLTEKMASELAEVYRQPINEHNFGLYKLRKKAAEKLKMLASGKCRNITDAAR